MLSNKDLNHYHNKIMATKKFDLPIANTEYVQDVGILLGYICELLGELQDKQEAAELSTKRIMQRALKEIQFKFLPVTTTIQ